MRGFIEVTEFGSECKVLFPISGIVSVIEDGNGAIIELFFTSRGESIETTVRESFAEVKEKIAQAV
jgi:hypothetical protein